MTFIRNVMCVIFLISLSPIVCAGGDEKDQKINNEHKQTIANLSDQETRELAEGLWNITFVTQEVVNLAVRNIIEKRNEKQ